jgi:ribosomal-protein-alanine N-acetyltransferase
VPCAKLLSPAEELDAPSPRTRRLAEARDIAALVELDRVCFGPQAWSLKLWREVVTRPEWTTEIIEANRQIVAASVLLPAAPVSWLASLAVHPSERRRGLARLLLRQALARARDASARSLSLEVDCVNRGAIQLYRREGFTILRRFREQGRWRQELVHRLGGRHGL